MDFERDVLNQLNGNIYKWASQLSANDILRILQTVYNIPGFVIAIDEFNTTQNTQEECAANIGKRGELEFETLCKQLPSNYKLINTAKIGHVGDFILEYHRNRKKYRCLIDIKNYKGVVPGKEVVKFIHDLTYGTYDAGLIISLNSRFSNITDHIYIEEKPLPYGIVPIMYLSKTTNDLIIQCIEALFLKTWVAKEKQYTFDKTQDAINFINIALSQSGATRRMLSNLHVTISSQITLCQEQLIGSEVQIKQAIKQLEKSINIHQAPPLMITPPNVSQRMNNLADTRIEPTVNLEIINNSNTGNNIDNSNTDNNIDNSNAGNNIDNSTTGNNDFIYSKYKFDDIKKIQQLITLDWAEILQEDDGSEATFISSLVVITVRPMKTKTKLIINKKILIESDKIKIKSLLVLFKEKNKHYVADLNQKIIDWLNTHIPAV